MTNAPMVYNHLHDEMRPATQDDVDRLQMAVNCFGALRYLIKGIIDDPRPFQPQDWQRHLTLLQALNEKLDELRAGRPMVG